MIGIITQINQPNARVDLARAWLELAGCKTIFKISTVTGDGVPDLLEYLKEAGDKMPWESEGELNASFQYLRLEQYDGLFITGGRAPEYLRLDERVLDIVRYFMNGNKPVAAICHGVQILTAAGVLKGRKVTAYDTVKPEVEAVGGFFIKMEPFEAYTDKLLITSPAYSVLV
ncbi:MAG: DJ-1/PfpI family protein [Lachnospiraceae bacterium]